MNTHKMSNFNLQMWLAKRRTGFLCWDIKWKEWVFIEMFAWNKLKNKEFLEIIKEFNNEPI